MYITSLQRCKGSSLRPLLPPYYFPYRNLHFLQRFFKWHGLQAPLLSSHSLFQLALDCKEIQPVHSKGDQSWVFFEGLMLKLKLQYFGHLMRRVDSLKKTLMLGGIWGRRRRGRQRMRCWMASPTRWTRVWVNSGRWWWTGRPGVLQFMGSQRVGHYWATELNWCVFVS